MADLDISKLLDITEEEIAEVAETINFDVLQGDREGNKRFSSVSCDDVTKFLDEQENVNTRKKTEIDVKVFCQYLIYVGDYRLPEEISAVELNDLICSFLQSVRKRDGGEYEPSTLRAYISSLDRYLKKKDTGINILKDDVFEKTRKTLKAKQKQLKSIGKGNKPNAADPLTANNIEEMYQAENLGCCNPTALQNSMWMICTVQFGMRTGTETHNLRWGDIKLVEEEGAEFFIYTQERQTKTRTGENPRDIRTVKPRAYSTDGSNSDPVLQYKLFAEKRPTGWTDPDSPFFLAVNHSYKQGASWYKKCPLGINSLYKIMKTMTEGTTMKENKRITPYSARKHLMQSLTDEGVPANQIIQVSGHRNVNSINNYSKLNPDQQKSISHLLSKKSGSSTVSSADAIVPHSLSSGIGEIRCQQQPKQVVGQDTRPVLATFSSETRSQQQMPSFSSMFSGNNIYGNIIISPEMFRSTSAQAANTVSSQSAVRVVSKITSDLSDMLQ